MAQTACHRSYVVILPITWLLIISRTDCVASKLNVLFIVSDDLRPSLGCYGGPIISPNIDQLAAQSAVFVNAMIQQSVCAPSRVSFLTGRRPDTTKLYDFGSYWRTHAGNYTTLPQHFRDNGYLTFSVGKIFHPGVTSGYSDDFPYSWSLPPFHSSTQKFSHDKLCPGQDGKLHNNVMCPVNVTEMPQSTLPDIQILEAAESFLRILSSQASEGRNDPELHNASNGSGEPWDRFQSASLSQPFFLAVGFRKPHIPWRYPQEYQSLYPLDSVDIATNPRIPKNMPSVAWEDYRTLREKDDISAMNLSFPYGTIPLKHHAAMRQSYYAAVTYVDYQVGRLLQALEDGGFANNTIISLIGDHGWQLGEHAEWCKYSNFELATRVPLLVHVPGVTDRNVGRTRSKKFPIVDVLQSKSTSGRESQADMTMKSFQAEKKHGVSSKNRHQIDEFVELVDLFSSLSELANLPIPPVCPPRPFNVTLCTEGFSFAPLIKQAALNGPRRRCCLPKNYERWKNATFSQYPRPGLLPNKHTDLPALKLITVMGYSMRTVYYHYTEWIAFNCSTFEGEWSDVKARELYLNHLDPQQNNNVANKAEYMDVVRHLSRQLERGWRDSLPVLLSQ